MKLIKEIFILLTLVTTATCYSFEALKRDTKDEYLVKKLPGLFDMPHDEIPLMFSGQLEIYKENDTNLFFWKYVDNNIDPEFKKRTIFWLNGGPGCSSMDGALMEAGPFRISDDGKVIKNEGSWHNAGDIVFVDQPAGTGFSYTKEYDHDLDQVARQFLKFLEKFYELFPEDRENEIYFAGESYAGQYIPYIAKAILDFNKNTDKPYNLKGLLIGNGWIAPDVQSLSYLPFALAANIIDNKNSEWGNILRQHEKCQNVVNSKSGDTLSDSEVVSRTCEVILNKILFATLDHSMNEDQRCFNMYDYTLKDSYPSCGMNWPPDLVNVNPFLNSEEVQHDLNLKLFKKWHECSGKVGRNFNAKHSIPSVKILPDILEQIPIVLFHGNRDIICNYIGAENFIKEMKWNGETGFKSDETFDWIYNNDISGYIKTERNLTFVNVFDSSHMVPFDKPEVSRSLIDILLQNYDIVDFEATGGSKKRAIKTYPLGVRKLTSPSPSESADVNSIIESASMSKATGKAKPSSVVSDTSASSSPSSTTTDLSDSDSDSDSDDENETSSKLTRIIQFIVLVIILWGIYMLYSHYRTRPSSIIKTKPSGRKKNVQWADQLRQFHDGDANEPGFITKALNKFRGIDDRGNYDHVAEDIELGENVNHIDEFIIDSDDETHPYKESQRSQSDESHQSQDGTNDTKSDV
ncbi:pheromone-processing carboxypeptidase Kex1p [[Candida] jaroonii]|uniref:Pheromone-processing carboxypeptidase Kex1p n=1 Tax=[Candida] jaroonii TaxID=467808 RepID=A0ACA9YGB0_9ASCO|nr:pheromone-processing carboxypeptidase Kex1p [[Candida] jaroonii]